MSTPTKDATAKDVTTKNEDGTTKYTLPGGAIAVCGRVNAGVRRALAGQPDTNFQFFQEIIGAATILKMTLPKGYNDGEVKEETVTEYDPNKLADAHARLDGLSLGDLQVFNAAFQELNYHARDIAEQAIAAIKATKGKA